MQRLNKWQEKQCVNGLNLMHWLKIKINDTGTICTQRKVENNYMKDVLWHNVTAGFLHVKCDAHSFIPITCCIHQVSINLLLLDGATRESKICLHKNITSLGVA